MSDFVTSPSEIIQITLPTVCFCAKNADVKDLCGHRGVQRTLCWLTNHEAYPHLIPPHRQTRSLLRAHIIQQVPYRPHPVYTRASTVDHQVVHNSNTPSNVEAHHPTPTATPPPSKNQAILPQKNTRRPTRMFPRGVESGERQPHPPSRPSSRPSSPSATQRALLVQDPLLPAAQAQDAPPALAAQTTSSWEHATECTTSPFAVVRCTPRRVS